MSLLDRINLLIRSEFNDLGRTDRRSHSLHEMESSLRDARRQQARLRADEKKLILQVRELREKAQRWEDRAILALKANDEELAREALVQKNRTWAEVDARREELRELRAYTEDIERAVQALEVKRRATHERSRDLAGGRPTGPERAGRPVDTEAGWDAELQRRIGAGAGEGAPVHPSRTFSEDRSFREFDRMAAKIDAAEAEVSAAAELGQDDLIDPRRRELESIFERMETTKRQDDDLADLKRKFSD